MKKLLVAVSLVLAASSAMAQNIPGLSAGKEYTVLNVTDTQAVAPVANKPLVLEFFWYGCPHCYDMDANVNQLVKSEGDSIEFKRVPVVYPRWESGAKLFYTFEEMGLLEKLHTKAFEAIHKDKINIMDDAQARDVWLTKQGVDAKQFEATYNGFAVATRIAKGKNYLTNYKITGTPTFVVNNKYSISPGNVATNNEQETYNLTLKDLKIIIDSNKKK